MAEVAVELDLVNVGRLSDGDGKLERHARRRA